MPSRVAQLTKNVKQRIVYKDFSPNLELFPITGELLILTNQQAVAQSIKNLILTYPGERYYNPNLGSTISRSTFEFVDDFTLDQIRDSIKQTIQTYEPRAQNLQLQVTASPVQHSVSVDISFAIALFPDQPMSIPTLVVKLRG